VRTARPRHLRPPPTAPDQPTSPRGIARTFGVTFVLLATGLPTSASPQRSDGYRVVAVEHPATLAGRVTFVGDVPRARRFMITKDVEVCGLGYRERAEVEVADGRGLLNVIVIVEGVEAGKPWPDGAKRYELSQENCVFAPHVQVVPKGAELHILNPDPVLHNIHSFEAIGSSWRTLFNFGQPPEKRTITHRLRPRRGNRIRLECDAHDFMLGWIYAAESPYAVVVDEAGRFSIDGIPPGTYAVTAWHPYLGVREQEVTLAPDERFDAAFEFSAK